MDALCKALEARGHSVNVIRSEWGSHYTAATILGQQIRFGLSCDNAGRFDLHIDQPTYGLRGRWRDGKRQRVEHCLGDFICTMVQIAAQQEDVSRLEGNRRPLGE